MSNFNNSVELVLLKQGSLGRERYAKNEIQTEVHVVAKNVSFCLDIELQGADFTFHQTKVQASLFYDINGQLKPVESVKAPMNYCAYFNNQGDRVSLDVKLAILSSQNDDCLFRLSIVLLDIANEPLAATLLSEPIKVVSKPSMVGKGKRGYVKNTEESPMKKKESTFIPRNQRS